MPGGNAVDFVFDRTGVGVDIDAGGGLQNGCHRCDFGRECRGAPFECAWYSISPGIASKSGRKPACHALFFAYHYGQKRQAKEGETGMTSRIEPYRVSAYNTSKHSENKMHDDSVAKRYGFDGGLVPGVDVMPT
jgi:hypothetical protein